MDSIIAGHWKVSVITNITLQPIRNDICEEFEGLDDVCSQQQSWKHNQDIVTGWVSSQPFWFSSLFISPTRGFLFRLLSINVRLHFIVPNQCLNPYNQVMQCFVFNTLTLHYQHTLTLSGNSNRLITHNDNLLWLLCFFDCHPRNCVHCLKLQIRNWMVGN